MPARFNRESRTGEFFQYDFQIDPYSLKPKSPQERSAIAESFLMKIVVPLMPQMQQAGMSIDWEYLMKMFARYSNTPELDHMILYTGGESIAPETRRAARCRRLRHASTFARIVLAQLVTA